MVCWCSIEDPRCEYGLRGGPTTPPDKHMDVLTSVWEFRASQTFGKEALIPKPATISLPSKKRL